MKRYFEFTDETIVVYGVTVYRIRATEDIDEHNVKKGDLGGFVQRKLNIRGRAWVFDNAVVMENAYVTDNAAVRGNACVSGNAVVRGHAVVREYAFVFDEARVNEYAMVAGNAMVKGNARLFGHAVLKGHARVSGNAVLEDGACVSGEAIISGNARVGDVAYITGNVVIADRAIVRGVVELDGRTWIQDQVLIDIYPHDQLLRICSDAVFQGNAVIHSLNDFIIMHNNWSSGRHFVWTRSNNMWSAGCFYGTGEELIKKAMQDSSVSGRGYKHAVDYVESMLKDEGKPVVV